MLFLDAEIPPITVETDSLHIVAQNLLQKLQDDPNGFWLELIEHIINFGFSVLAALVIYIIGAWLIGHVKRTLKKVFVKKNTERTLASFITSLVSITMTILLIIITVSTLGVNTTSLAALLAAGGMAIGMALSGTVQNFAGGIMLLIFKPFSAGDFIEAQGHKGTVMEVNIVSTKILTPDNRVVILPNGALSNGQVNNFSAQPLRRVEWVISVSYGVSVEQMKEYVLSTFKGDKRILTSADKRPHVASVTGVDTSDRPIPDPFVRLSSLNANDISFTIRAWVNAADFFGVYFDYMERFYTELPERGMTFAYPHMDVHIEQG